jgi:hypothetical protein
VGDVEGLARILANEVLGFAIGCFLQGYIYLEWQNRHHFQFAYLLFVYFPNSNGGVANRLEKLQGYFLLVVVVERGVSLSSSELVKNLYFNEIRWLAI